MHLSLSTHASLLGRLAAGSDASAWSEFTARYRELILGFGRRRGLQLADLDDVLQDTLLALSGAMPGFAYDPGRGSFRGFLKTIVVRVVAKRLRRPPLPSCDPAEVGAAAADPELEAAFEEEWRQHHLRSAMARVRSEHRATDVRAFELLSSGRDAASVAKELGISVDAAYQIKSRILRRLRELVAAQVAEEG